MLARTHTLHLPPISYPSGKGTFIVETNPKCEGRAYLGLEAKGFEPYLPKMLEERARWRGKRRTVYEVEKPLFSYIFVKFDPNKDEWWQPIKSTDGVKRLLCNGPQFIPTRVSTVEIEKLKRAEAAGVFDFRPKIEPGDRVRIADQSDPRFYNFIATFLLAKPHQRAEVAIEWLGQQCKLELYMGSLEKV